MVKTLKKFNITAQVYDLCSSNPKQSMIINELVDAESKNQAEQRFKTSTLIDDIEIIKIYSVEEI